MTTFSNGAEQVAVRRIELGGIGIKADRLRALRPDTVKELMASMKSTGCCSRSCCARRNLRLLAGRWQAPA